MDKKTAIVIIRQFVSAFESKKEFEWLVKAMIFIDKLVENQQKEIEEWRNGIRINDKVSIPKDKIRAKIEKLKEIADEDNPDDYIKIDAYEELLEEK